MDLTRTISDTTGTIPQAQAISTYTATTDTTDNSVLQVTGGTIPLSTITWSTATGIDFPTGLNDGTCSIDGYYYIFIAGGTPKIAKIIGITQTGYNTGTGVYSYGLQLDVPMIGVSTASFSVIIGNDVSYTYNNVGASPATVDGIAVAAGQTVPFLQTTQPSTNNLYRPVYVDASSTTLFIQEINCNPNV